MSSNLSRNDARRPGVAGSPRAWFVAIILGVAIAAVYGRALNAPFLFDDQISITENPSIESLWPPFGTEDHPGPLNPERDLPTSGRPLVNLSFALNFFFGGHNPLGYHMVNVVIHILTACLLFAVVRRTLLLPYFKGRFDANAGWLALACALLWALHPLQTEAVIYTTQRTELMMALFYLATFYFSLRYWSAEAASPTASSNRMTWLTLAVLSCACGMASKEVMVSAPVIVLLFDRAFISGSIVRALRESRPLYTGLFATWIVLFALNINSPRSGSAGFHFDVPAYQWWLTQCEVLLIYLKLAFWPSPLLCEYELPYFKTVADAWQYLLPVFLFGLVTIVLLLQNRPLGFLLSFIAAVLAPTFFVPILTETAAERRMYLPLASLVVIVVVGAFLLLDTWQKRRESKSTPARWKFAVPIAAVIIALAGGIASARRLSDYYDETLLWRQVEEAQPNNYLAHYNLGLLLNYAGREQESFDELQKSVESNPNYPNSRSALGFALIHAGRMQEALDSLNAALAINPDHVGALDNLGIALIQMGRYPEAIDVLQHALRVDPHHADARNNLGRALTAAGRATEAQQVLEGAKSSSPDDPDVLNNLGSTLAAQGQLPQAIEQFKHSLELRPDFSAAHNNLGIALYNAGDIPGSIEHFRRFLELNPTNAGAYCNLGNVIGAQGDFKQAAELYEKAVQLQPNAAEAHFSLGTAFVKLDRGPEAIAQFQEALRLNPGLLVIYPNLADVLAAAHETADAIEVAQRGSEAARSAGNTPLAEQLEQFIKKYQAKP